MRPHPLWRSVPLAVYVSALVIMVAGSYIDATRTPVEVILSSQDSIGEVSVNCEEPQQIDAKEWRKDLGWFGGDDFLVIQAHTDQAGADFDATVHAGGRTWEAAPGRKRIRLGSTAREYLYFYALSGSGRPLGRVPCHDVVPGLGYPPISLREHDPLGSFWTGPLPGFLTGATTVIAIVAALAGLGVMVIRRKDYLWVLPWVVVLATSAGFGVAEQDIAQAALALLGLVVAAPLALRAAGFKLRRADEGPESPSS